MHTIGVSRTVNMAIVPVVGLILNVGRVDCDTASLFFRSLVDFCIAGEFCTTSAGENLGDCSSQGSFTVIDMTYPGS